LFFLYQEIVQIGHFSQLAKTPDWVINPNGVQEQIGRVVVATLTCVVM